MGDATEPGEAQFCSSRTWNQARPKPAGTSTGNKLSQIPGMSSLFPYIP